MTDPQEHGYAYEVRFGEEPSAEEPPVRKKRTRAIVAAVVAALLVGALAVTGFVTPGFFLADDTPRAAPPATTTTTTPPPATTPPGLGEEPRDPERFLGDIVNAMDQHQVRELGGYVCDNPYSSVAEAVDSNDTVSQAILADTKRMSDKEYIGKVKILAGGEEGIFELTVARENGDWCWLRITGPSGSTETTYPPDEPTAGGRPVDANALLTVGSFTAALNLGDAAAATKLLCADATDTPAEVDAVIARQPRLEVDPALDGRVDGDMVQLYLTGEIDGRDLTEYSGKVAVTGAGDNWCVHDFRAIG